MAFIRGKLDYYGHGDTIGYDDGVTDGADQIIGTFRADHIFAGGGNDIIKGGGGADTIDGGEGRDGASYEDSGTGVEVSLQLGLGKGGTAEGDKLSNIEDLYGSKFDDTLVGDKNDNRLDGGAGNDILKGGGGTDVLNGGAGDDRMEIDGVEDHANGGDGIDTLVLSTSKGMMVNLGTGFVDPNSNGQGWYGQYSHWSDYVGYYAPHAQGTPDQISGIENVVGSAYDDDIYGNALANDLSGNGGNDLLSGRGGDDFIDGGSGNDFLYGGIGADTLMGGFGNDIFIFTKFEDSTVVNGKPQDVIVDFQHGEDKIDLTAVASDLAYGDLHVMDNQTIDGANYSIVTIDTNHDGIYGEGDFAIAVKMAPGTVLHQNDFIIA